MRFHFVGWLKIKNKLEQAGVPPKIAHYLVPKLPWSSMRGNWVFRCTEEELKSIQFPLISITRYDEENWEPEEHWD